jgi:hypothetical protein
VVRAIIPLRGAAHAYGIIVTDYRGTLPFSSPDSTANLPKKYTFTATDQGVHTFTGTPKGSRPIVTRRPVLIQREIDTGSLKLLNVYVPPAYTDERE